MAAGCGDSGNSDKGGTEGSTGASTSSSDLAYSGDLEFMHFSTEELVLKLTGHSDAVKVWLNEPGKVMLLVSIPLI